MIIHYIFFSHILHSFPIGEVCNCVYIICDLEKFIMFYPSVFVCLLTGHVQVTDMRYQDGQFPPSQDIATSWSLRGIICYILPLKLLLQFILIIGDSPSAGHCKWFRKNARRKMWIGNIFDAGGCCC